MLMVIILAAAAHDPPAYAGNVCLVLLADRWPRKTVCRPQPSPVDSDPAVHRMTANPVENISISISAAPTTVS